MRGHARARRVVLRTMLQTTVHHWGLPCGPYIVHSRVDSPVDSSCGLYCRVAGFTADFFFCGLYCELWHSFHERQRLTQFACSPNDVLPCGLLYCGLYRALYNRLCSGFNCEFYCWVGLYCGLDCVLYASVPPCPSEPAPEGHPVPERSKVQSMTWGNCGKPWTLQ